MEEFAQFNFEVLLIRWYRFFRKNFWFVQIFTVLGLALGIVYNKYKTPEYVSNAIVYSNLVGAERSKQIIDDLSEYTQKQSFGLLAEELGITVEQASKIKQIEVSVLPSSPSTKTELDVVYNDYLQNSLAIELTVLDPNIIKLAEEGLKHSFSKNEFLSRLKTSRNKSIATMIEKIDEQIRSIEEEQTKSKEISEGKDNVIINTDINTTSRDLIFLMERKTIYEEELATNSIEIIKPFYFPERPESHNLIFLAAGIILGFFVGVGLALLRKINSMY